MPHIQLPELPGIAALLTGYPETGKPLRELSEILLRRGTPNFSHAERETVANYVSFLNECVFCSESHAAAADYLWQKEGKPPLSKKIWESLDHAPTPRFRALLRIAGKVAKTPGQVMSAEIEEAKRHGATEQDIHDAVLIASAFCLYNRYVDGLGTYVPKRGDPVYAEMGRKMAEEGFLK